MKTSTPLCRRTRRVNIPLAVPYLYPPHQHHHVNFRQHHNKELAACQLFKGTTFNIRKRKGTKLPKRVNFNFKHFTINKEKKTAQIFCAYLVTDKKS